MKSFATIMFLTVVVIQLNSSTKVTALSCDSCGRECASACGTRNFRTCCFNYLRKRSDPESSESGLRLELLMVVPELAQRYPSLRNLMKSSQIIPSTGSVQMVYEDDDVRVEPLTPVKRVIS